MGSVAVALIAAALAVDAAPRVTLRARAMQPGEVVVITVIAAADAGIHVNAFRRDVPAFKTGERRWQALLGIDLDVAPGTYPVTVRSGGETIVRDLVVRPKVFRTRRLTVNPDFVTPPPSEAARIAADAKLLEAVWNTPAPERLWAAFAAPVTQPSNSAFGTRSIFNGLPRNAHGGADFLSPAGTPVAAPAGGRIAVARNLYYSGNTVIIDHGLGVFSMLAHLSKIDVHEGEAVAARAIVGEVGATGRVTGPHLHWAVRIGSARVDPMSLLDAAGTP